MGRLSRLAVAFAVVAGVRYTSASTVEVVVTESDLLAWTGDSDSDPRGLARLSDGRFVYFEDEPGAGAAEDAVVMVDPSLSGNDRFSVVATESAIIALAPNGIQANLHVSDIAVSPGDDIYLVACERSAGNFDNFVVELPFNGAGHDAPVLVTDFFDGGDDGSGRTRHRLALDPLRNRLYALFDDLDAANDGGGVHGSNGVYTFDFSLQPGTVNDLALFVSYVDVGSAVTPPVDFGNEEMGLWQIRADSEGNIFGAHSSGSGEHDGDVVRISATDGTVELFLDQLEAELATGNLNQFTLDTNLALHPSNDHVYLFETGTTIESRENVYEFAPDGEFLGLIVAHDQVTDTLPPVGPVFTVANSNPFLVDDAGDVYFFLSGADATDETIVSVDVSGACSEGPTLSFIWPTGDVVSPDPSSPYGPRQLASGNFRHDWHRGVDIAMPVGTDVFAVEDGVVEDAGVLSGFSDPLVILRHGRCPPYVYSYFLHLSTTTVSKEQLVSRGEKVGESGASSSGFAHLHFETRVGCNSQSCNHNPYERLPYLDVTPPQPALAGYNLAGDQTVLLLDFDVPDSQIDLNGVELSWGTTNVVWNWQDSNRSNSPSFPSALDRPITRFGGGVHGAIWPEHMNQASSGALYSWAVAGLDVNATTGSATLRDVHGAGTVLAVGLLPRDLDVCPATVEVVASPGDAVSFEHILSNESLDPVTVTLDARSAAKNVVILSDETLTFGPGVSHLVTVNMSLSASHEPGLGDAILLEIGTGEGLPIVALDSVCFGASCQSAPAPPATVVVLATSETSVGGTQFGELDDTFVSDDSYESIEEEQTGGKPSRRKSLLEHHWTFAVPDGVAHTLEVEAFRSPASGEDTFTFAYSIDGGSFTDALTVTKTFDDDVPQSFVLPSGVAGQTITIRAQDTDRQGGSTSLDTLHVDKVSITAESGITPPNPFESCAVTYVVESVDLATVNAGKGRKRGRVTVTVLDDEGLPAPGVGVTGTFTGDFTETAIETTDPGGVAVFTTTDSRRGSSSFSFVVDALE